MLFFIKYILHKKKFIYLKTLYHQAIKLFFSESSNGYLDNEIIDIQTATYTRFRPKAL